MTPPVGPPVRKAVIMAGGEGTRLRPLTSNQPKPMVPVANRPLMEHTVRLLRLHGFDDVVVTVQFLASVVRNYFGDGSDLGLELKYVTEESPLGTAGSVKNAEGALDEPFIVVSGDALTDINLADVVRFHQERGAVATMVLSRQPDPLEYGIVVVDNAGRVERFLEKPGWGQVFTDTVNTGIYVLEPEVFGYIPSETPFDFSKDLFPILLDKGAPLYGFVAQGYWTDVGSFDAYMRAQRDALDGAVAIDLPGEEIAQGVWAADGAIVDAEARLDGPVLLGRHAKVEAGAHVREYSVVGDNTVVKTGAVLHRVTVHDNAYIGPGAHLRGCVVGRNVDVRANALIEEGVVIGDEGLVGEGAVLQPNVKVYPFKTVEPGAVISRSIVWESRGTRTLFGSRGVSGLINVDITPEFAVRFARAYATTLQLGSTVVTSRDVSRAARMIKRALIAGLNGSGINVHDLEVAPVPVTRFHVRTARALGGISVGTLPGDPQSIEIRVLDQGGADVDEGMQRAIERVYYREDARRAFADEVGELRFPPRALDFYQAGLLGVLDLERIRAARIRAVVDCVFGSSALVLPGVLGRLGSDVLTVNAYVDEARPTLSEEQRSAHLRQLADVVRGARADIGAMLDPAGEAIDLVASGGTVVSRDQALLVLVDLVSSHRPGGTIVVPVSVSSAVESIVEAAGGRVVRTKHSASALSAALIEENAVFCGTRDGAYAFPEFLPAFDGLASFAMVLELLAATGAKLSDRAEVVRPGHVLHQTVSTPADRKGAVMRGVAERQRGDRTEEVEGLKIFHGPNWALVVPDPERPVTHVWAEAGSSEESAEWLAQYVAMVEEAID